MKRQAEKQIGKDDDEEEDNENPGQGFKKADEAVLATRAIRGLPKRGGARAPENAPSATPMPSPFSTTSIPGASGFSTGTPATNTTSSPFSGFSFKPTTEAGDNPPTASNSFFSVKPSTSPFATTPSQPSSAFAPSPNPFSSSLPTTTNTSKAFASIISNSSAANPFAPASQSASSSADGKTSNESVPEKYYTDLRGLNTSVVSAISRTVESDPFVDISDLLEQYKTLRLKIQKDFDNSSKSDSKQAPTGNASAPAESNKPAMPAPPVAFAGFNAGKPMTTPAPVSTGPPKTNLFEFKGTSSTSAPNPFGASKDSPATPTLFGSSLSTTPAAPSAGAPTVPSFFTFGAPSNKASTSSPFGTFGNPAPSAFSVGGSSTSTTAKSVFGTSSTTISSPFSGFGSNTTEKPASSNLFGSSDKSSASFAFGSTSATTEASKTTSLFGSGSSGSPFGGAKPSSGTTGAEKPASDDVVSQETQDNASPTTAEGADPATAGLIANTNPHDEDGEGEENEETTHSSRSKAYKLAKDAEGTMKWIGIGSGLLKLKRDKASGARRVLLRNSTNGKVVMNFNLYEGLKPTQSKTSVTFMGHDAGTSQTYSVRTATETDAQELKGALEREIAFVKAKES